MIFKNFARIAGIAAGLTLVAAQVGFAQAGTPAGAGPVGAPTPSEGQHQPHGNWGGNMGTVSNVTSAGFTLTTLDGTAVPVKIGPETKIGITSEGATTDLKTGDMIMVQGKVDDTASTVTAHHILVASAEMAKHAHGTNMPSHNDRGVIGTVSATTPNLTVQTSDGKTYTIATTPRTQVTMRHEGAASDLANGAMVRVMGAAAPGSTDTTLTARRIEVMPAGAAHDRAPHHHADAGAPAAE